MNIELPDDIPEVPRVERLSLKPGDRLVFCFEKYLSEREADDLREKLKAQGFPRGTMILDGGATLRVIEGLPE